MACQSPNIREEDNAGLEGNPQNQQLTQHSSSSSESGRSSGYAGSFDLPEDSVFGDVKRRPHQCSCKKGTAFSNPYYNHHLYAKRELIS